MLVMERSSMWKKNVDIACKHKQQDMINYRFGQKQVKILKVERPLNIVLLLLLVHFPLGSVHRLRCTGQRGRNSLNSWPHSILQYVPLQHHRCCNSLSSGHIARKGAYRVLHLFPLPQCVKYHVFLPWSNTQYRITLNLFFSWIAWNIDTWMLSQIV